MSKYEVERVCRFTFNLVYVVRSTCLYGAACKQLEEGRCNLVCGLELCIHKATGNYISNPCCLPGHEKSLEVAIVLIKME